MELLNNYSELAGRMPYRLGRKKTGTAHTSRSLAVIVKYDTTKKKVI